MKQRIIVFVAIFALFTAMMVIQKPLFLLACTPDGIGFWSLLFPVIWHGLAMDCTMAGYLTILPGILLIISCCKVTEKVLLWLRKTCLWYIGVMVFLMSMIVMVDLALYDSWGFRLDATPFFYIFTSFSSAMASITAWQMIAGIIGIILLAALYFFAFYYLLKIKRLWPILTITNHRIRAIIIQILLLYLLFIPIRGGFTVSTMNPSRAYFSENMFLNHAALNPEFTLLYSLSHQSDFSKQFRYMEDAEAQAEFNRITVPDSIGTPVSKISPDHIYLIILESFSSYLLPVQGGEPIAMRLDSLAREGLLFDNFYGNSFRTDRALPAILSAFPAQPTTSVMKYVNKAEQLPSLGDEMRNSGYKTSYFYGGDANFTNMLAYLRAQGFEKIISDRDFSASQLRSKWGAHDEKVFEKAFNELEPGKSFTVIQTSSSHEPFDVPRTFTRYSYDERVNAFAYADSCLGDFMDKLKGTPQWDKTLVIIVPDHLGVYPHGNEIPTPVLKHHIPMVMTGGALPDKGINHVPASQIDIAATLLGLLGKDTSKFPYSKDILNTRSKHYGVFNEKDFAGMVWDNDTTILELETGKVTGKNEKAVKAFLQLLYNDLSSLGTR